MQLTQDETKATLAALRIRAYHLKTSGTLPTQEPIVASAIRKLEATLKVEVRA